MAKLQAGDTKQYRVKKDLKTAIPDVTDLFKQDERVFVLDSKAINNHIPINVTEEAMRLGLQKKRREAQARRQREFEALGHDTKVSKKKGHDKDDLKINRKPTLVSQ